MLPNRKIDGKHSWTHLNIYTIWYNVYLGRLATRAKSPLAHPLPCDLRANCTPDRESSSCLPRPLQPLVDQNGPCHQGWVRIEFGYPTKKIKRCKAIRTMMVAKYLHCCFVFIVVFFSSPPSRIWLGHFFEEPNPQTCERLLWPGMPDMLDHDFDLSI